MMKMKGGDIVRSVESDFVVETNISDTRVICILNGEASCDGKMLERGSCVVVPCGHSVSIAVENLVDYAWLDIENFEKKQIELLNTAYPDKIELLAKLVCDADEAHDIENLFFDGAAKMLLALLAPEKLDSVGNKHVDMAKRYIDSNYGKQIKVEDIADSLGVDRKYLRNLFFKYLGNSTKDYLTEVRIEKAKELLLQSSVAVSEIASAVGYPDALAFSKMFKKHVGISPSDYRNGIAVDKPEEKKEETPKPKKEDIKYFLL